MVDIENPNSRNNSICSIGIIVVENGVVKEKIYSLIDPEDRFDSQSININGIGPSMVVGKPTFKDYWNMIGNLLTSNVIVGHNIRYDLSVISKSLQRYDIEAPDFNYYCTLGLARKYIPSDSYKLDVIANKLGICFNHHNALEDAETSQQIFEFINKNNALGIEEPEEYYYEDNTIDNLNAKLEGNINDLYGIIQGINYDGIINENEIIQIKKWVENNRMYRQYTLFDRIINSLDRILEDNIISQYEKIELIKLVESINSSKLYRNSTLALQIMQGIILGISCDNVINIEEINSLNKWLGENNYLADVYPYDKVYLAVKGVLEDGVITGDEKQYLMTTFNEIINPSYSNGYESIDFNNKSFCLTGEFSTGLREEISNKIIAKGGIEKSSVSSKLDYLFVGAMGSEAWKFGKVGGKIAKAQELNEKGLNIKIIGESDLVKQL